MDMQQATYLNYQLCPLKSSETIVDEMTRISLQLIDL